MVSPVERFALKSNGSVLTFLSGIIVSLGANLVIVAFVGGSEVISNGRIVVGSVLWLVSGGVIGSLGGIISSLDRLSGEESIQTGDSRSKIKAGYVSASGLRISLAGLVGGVTAALGFLVLVG